MKTIIAAIMSLLPLLTLGCSDMYEGSDANMRDWFQRGTGLTLPADAQFIAGKDHSAYLSDIYLKLKVHPDFQSKLDQQLNRTNRPAAFVPPFELKGWSTQDLAGKALTYYEHETGDYDRGGYITLIAWEAATGTMFCHFVEYAP